MIIIDLRTVEIGTFDCRNGFEEIDRLMFHIYRKVIIEIPMQKSIQFKRLNRPIIVATVLLDTF